MGFTLRLLQKDIFELEPSGLRCWRNGLEQMP